MKLRLPTILITAIIAAVATPTVQAAAACTAEISEIINVAKGETQSIVSDASPYEEYRSIAKDGEGTATITGDVTKYSAIYVREGELKIGDGTTKTNLTISATFATDCYDVGLSVSGKDAVITFDNATYKNINNTDQEHFTQVGGSDGNGTMNITNGSHLDLISNSNFFVGNQYYSNDTTAEPGSEERYQGNYTTAADGSGTKLGKGIVNVTSGSTLSTGYHNFWMSEGEVNVDGKGSVANICNYNGNNTYLALEEHSTSTLNVTNGGKIVLNSANLITGFYGNSVTNLIADGENSELIRLNERPNHPEMNNAVKTATKFNSSNNTLTNIVATNGGKISLLSDQTVFNTDQSSNRLAEVSIDSKSSLAANTLIMSSGTNIDNDGTLSMTALQMNGGSISNSGIIAGDITMTDGTFTMENGAVAGGLTATSGSIYLSGNVTFTGAVQLGTVASTLVLFSGETETLTVYIAKDSTIVLDDSLLTVDGQQFVVGDNAQIIVDLGNVAYEEGTQLFTLQGKDGAQLTSTAASLEDNLLVTWTDGEGSTQTASGATVSGSITTVTVPEPTTATLSLLALAGLCARRRRN